MGKKQFIALADVIRAADRLSSFSDYQISILAAFCEAQNPRFNRERWLGYIAGTNGPSGGAR
jgi:hypothetical protein